MCDYPNKYNVARNGMAMFFVGLASLTAIAWNVLGQFTSEKDIFLDELQTSPNPLPGQPDENTAALKSIADQAADYGQQLYEFPKSLQGHYLWERLVNALHSIYRTGSASNLENELKYLSETDYHRQQQRYSLVRILIWATPMLGFLGTVLGISQALGGINVGPDNDFEQMMNGLRGNLYVAFDTTALALTLSMALMFVLFLVEKFESQLLRLVDQRASHELALYFESSISDDGGSGSKVVDAVNQMVESQTDIWRKTIKSAENAWSSSLTQANELVKDNLSESLDENVAALAHYLGESIEKADEAMAHRWSQWQITLSNNARQIERWQDALASQTQSVQSIVSSIDDSTSLKDSIHQQQEIVDSTTRVHDILTQVFNAADEQKKKQNQSSIKDNGMLDLVELPTEPRGIIPINESSTPVPDTVKQPQPATPPAPSPIRIFDETRNATAPSDSVATTRVKRFKLPTSSDSAQVLVRKRPGKQDNAA